MLNKSNKKFELAGQLFQNPRFAWISTESDKAVAAGKMNDIEHTLHGLGQAVCEIPNINGA